MTHPLVSRAKRARTMPAARSHAPLRVLVVDDDVDSRLLLGAMIESHLDAQAVLVTSVEEAARSVAIALPDLVVSDGMMPGGGAAELLERLRAIPRAARVPVIVATASGEGDFHRRLREAGARAVLAKPADPEALVRAVAAALEAGGG